MAITRALIYPDALVDKNMVSTADWSTDLEGSTNDFIEKLFGTNPLNQRVQDTGPFGETMYVWQGGQTGQSGARQGFNTDGVHFSAAKTVDYTKTYRLSVWVKQKATLSTGGIYIGVRAWNAANDSTVLIKHAVGGDPVMPFWAMTATTPASMTTYAPLGEWRLCVFYVFPVNYAGPISPDTGFITPSGIRLGINAGNYDARFTTDVSKITLMCYGPYGETGNGLIQFAYPRIDLVDGTEPSLQQLITGNTNLKPLHLDPRKEANLNLVSTSDWSTDLEGSTVDFNEYRYGTLPLNQRVLDLDPFGKQVHVWQGGQPGQVGASNGFNGINTENDIARAKSVDPSKTYRFSMWVRVKTAISSGSIYFGLRAFYSSNNMQAVKNVTAGTTTINPYFLSSNYGGVSTYLPTGEWRLLIGYLRPFGYSGTTDDNTSGYWKPDGTKLGGIASGTGDWIMTDAAVAKVLIRILAPYNETGDGVFQYVYPRIDLVDGTEPSFTELLTGRKPIALTGTSNVSNDFVMTIGPGLQTGSDVTRILIKVNSQTTATLSNNAYFTTSDDSVNNGQTLTLNADTFTSIYLHCDNGYSDFKVIDGISKITEVADVLRSGFGTSCYVYDFDIGANFPTNCTSFVLTDTANGAIHGYLSSLPTSLVNLKLGSSVNRAKVMFDLAIVPSSMVTLVVYNDESSSYAVYGDVSSLDTSTIGNLELYGCNLLTYTTSKTWSYNLRYDITLRPKTGFGMSQTDFNLLLVDLESDYDETLSIGTVDLRGGNPVPTGTGITAFNALLDVGFDIYTNLVLTTNTYSTPGPYTYTVPSNTARLEIECWGAGGQSGNGSVNYGYGGGGGGGYSKSKVVTPTAENLTVQVGYGNGQGGSYVQRPSLSYYALALEGGNGSTTAGGTGASTSGSVGNVAMYAGGNGGNGSVGGTYSGGGGGGANTTSKGANASTNTPGTSGDGGNGGAGWPSSGFNGYNGNAGSAPGGGGGGPLGSNLLPGYGGNGKIIIKRWSPA